MDWSIVREDFRMCSKILIILPANVSQGVQTKSLFICWKSSLFHHLHNILFIFLYFSITWIPFPCLCNVSKATLVFSNSIKLLSIIVCVANILFTSNSCVVSLYFIECFLFHLQQRWVMSVMLHHQKFESVLCNVDSCDVVWSSSSSSSSFLLL